jgi:HdeA/HdeB family
MKVTTVLLLVACLAPLAGRAAELNLATLSCDKYENEILGGADSTQTADPAKHADSIDTVMWLFGFSVAKSGEHVMYGDALTSFGFALDAECKNHPSTSLLEALGTVTPKRDKPMDLTSLNCATWEPRHEQSSHSDPESANTIMMWLFGYSAGLSGTHMFDPSGITRFASALQGRCTQHPDDSLFDALVAVAKIKH